MKANMKKILSLTLATALGISGGVYYNSHRQKTIIADEALVMPNNLDKLLNPTVPSSASDSWRGNYIYFGNYQQSSDGNGGYLNEPIKWRVLDKNNVAWDNSKSIQNNNFRYNVGRPADESTTGYGGRQNAPIGGNGILLTDDNIVAIDSTYQTGDNTNWRNLCWGQDVNNSNKKGCVMWAWLNNYSSNRVLDNQSIPSNPFLTTAFTEKERNLIMFSRVYTEDLCKNRNGASSYANSARTSLSEDKLFTLSNSETLNKNYGFWETTAASATRRFPYSSYVSSVTNSRGGWPWAICLRQANDIGVEQYRITEINGDGSYRYWNTAHGAARSDKPIVSMNFDPSSIFFISKADNTNESAYKSDRIGSAPTVFNLTSAIGNEYKLTVKDSSRNFNLDEEKTTQEGQILRLAYTNAKAGSNEYISCMIYPKNSPSDIIYYGKLCKVNSSSGTASLRIPTEITNGNYNIAVFNEQCNGAKETDWSSEPIVFGIDNEGNAKFAHKEPTVPDVQAISILPSSHSKSKANAQDTTVTLSGKNFSSNFKAYVTFKKKGENAVVFKYPQNGQQLSDSTPTSFSITIPKAALEQNLTEVGVYNVEAVIETN